MLPAQYRMTRSTEFGLTVNQGVRAAQPDLVVHALRSSATSRAPARRSGWWSSKSVGNAVQRHRVARRLRHVARTVIDELDPGDRVVIRALPGSRHAISARLEQELRTALRRVRSRRGSSAMTPAVTVGRRPRRDLRHRAVPQRRLAAAACRRAGSPRRAVSTRWRR